MTSSNASTLDVPSSSRTAITRHVESLRSTALYTCIVNHTVLYRPCLFGVWSLPFHRSTSPVCMLPQPLRETGHAVGRKRCADAVCRRYWIRNVCVRNYPTRPSVSRPCVRPFQSHVRWRASWSHYGRASAALECMFASADLRAFRRSCSIARRTPGYILRLRIYWLSTRLKKGAAPKLHPDSVPRPSHASFRLPASPPSNMAPKRRPPCQICKGNESKYSCSTCQVV
jgi:hypothetical protein